MSEVPQTNYSEEPSEKGELLPEIMIGEARFLVDGMLAGVFTEPETCEAANTTLDMAAEALGLREDWFDVLHPIFESGREPTVGELMSLMRRTNEQQE